VRRREEEEEEEEESRMSSLCRSHWMGLEGRNGSTKGEEKVRKDGKGNGGSRRLT